MTVPLLALFRTVRLDPRPTVGLLLTVIVSVTVSASVVAGALALMEAADAVTPGGADPLETIVELTALAALIAVAYAMRCFATSLRPEISALRAVGAPEPSISAFGAAAGTVALGAGLLVALTVGQHATDAWTRDVSDLLGVHPPEAATRVAAPWVAAACALPAGIGWRSGTRAAARNRTLSRWVRFATAGAAFLIICVPVALIVQHASLVSGLVGQHSDRRAADRLSVLGTSVGPVVVLGAASIAMAVAVILVAADIVALLVRASGPLLKPLAWRVGVAIAADNAYRFSPLVTVVATTLLLLQTRALTQSAAAGTDLGASPGADDRELALTLGPTLAVAASCAIGACLAQSRGTGGDLRRLGLVGAALRTRWSVLLIASVALGTSAVLVATLASVITAAIGRGSGALVDVTRALTAPACLAAAAAAVVGSAAVFSISELARSPTARPR